MDPVSPLPSQPQLPSHHAPTSLKVVLLAFAIVLVAVLGYLVWQQNSVGTDTTDATVTHPKTTVSTVGWKTYVDGSGVGFTFLYPPTAVAPSTTVKGTSDALSINAAVSTVSTAIEAPLGYAKANFEKDRTAIAKNDPTVSFGFGLIPSYKMITNGALKGKSYLTLAQLEVCNVQFTQIGHFYIGSSSDDLVQVIWQDLRVSAIEKANPSYFVADQANCGGALRWKDGAGTTFYQDLVAGKTDLMTQTWYKDFAGITSTFKLAK